MNPMNGMATCTQLTVTAVQDPETSAGLETEIGDMTDAG
jgi:hypothetical protein